MPKHFGTNSTEAWSDKCEKTGEKHIWIETKAGRCFYKYTCKDCKSTTSVDSGG